MKYTFLLFTLPLTAFLTCCQTATNRSVEEFKKVDSSLQKTNSIIIDNTYSTLYNQIQAKKDNNLKLALQADTVFQETEDAYRFIDDLIQKLNELDSSGIQLDIGTKLITNTNNSEKLTKKLNSVYTSALSVLTGKQQITQAENIFKVEQEIKANKNGSRKYFDGTPTVAAITILRKFKNDCVNLATLSLKEIKTDLVE